MNLKNLAAGLEIVRKYYNDPDGYHLGAEHDQIYLYSTDKPMTQEDAEKMVSLGWFQENGIKEGKTDGEYDPSDGWTAFA